MDPLNMHLMQQAANRDKIDEYHEKAIKSPSLLVMACNTMEILRMRQELIKILHENDELTEIYSAQSNGGKDLIQREALAFGL